MGFLDDGTFLFPNVTDGRVEILNSSGIDIGNFATGLTTPAVIKEHPNGSVYVLDRGAGTILKYDQSGNLQDTVVSGLSSAVSFSFHTQGSILAMEGTGGSATITKFHNAVSAPGGGSTLFWNGSDHYGLPNLVTNARGFTVVPDGPTFLIFDGDEAGVGEIHEFMGNTYLNEFESSVGHNDLWGLGSTPEFIPEPATLGLMMLGGLMLLRRRRA